MPDQPRFAYALAELTRAEQVVDELHAGCCDPLRSPRMETLASTIQGASKAVLDLDDDVEEADRVVVMLEDAGAQLGHLQVACCTPARTKLYTEALERLARSQRLVKRALDMDH